LALENYTVTSILDIVHAHGLQDKVDYVNGGHLSIFQTKLEETVARMDYERAKKAGVNVSVVEWMDRDEVWKVRSSTTLVLVT
jgi:hypothetical protein